MPLKCCVPGCKGNYDSTEKVSVFVFPKIEKERQLWIRKIPREQWKPTRNSVVCERHFHESDIMRVDNFQTGNEVIELPRKIPKLKEGAYPIHFPILPKYLNTKEVAKRKDPETRRQERQRLREIQEAELISKDNIHDYNSLCENISAKVLKKESVGQWFSLDSGDYFILYTLHIRDGELSICTSVSILKTSLKVKVIQDGKKMAKGELICMLPKDMILQRYSQLENVLSQLKKCEQTENVCCASSKALETASICIQEAIDDCENESTKTHLKFLQQQLALSMSTPKQRRYTSELLHFSYVVNCISASAYTMIRNSKFLILPHVHTLKTLSSDLSVCAGVNNERIQYLSKHADVLQDREKCVAILADEIHITDRASYKGGDIVGHAHNNMNSLATTVQSFMITSVLGNMKEIVALLPVSSTDAKYLTDQMCKVIEIVQKSGFVVSAIITDNNAINRKMFSLLKDKFDPSSSSSVDAMQNSACVKILNVMYPDRNIFLLFDTVHLFKCIRNNWINQKNSMQSFLYPDVSEYGLLPSKTDANITEKAQIINKSSNSAQGEVKEAQFVHIRQLYMSEQTDIIKLAPSLCHKAVFPSTLERQNVNLVLKVFNEKVIATLRSNGSEDMKSTADFMEVILSLWKIVNITHLYDGANKRDSLCNAFAEPTDKRLKFLSNFSLWIKSWNKMRGQCTSGYLTQETSTALAQTSATLVGLLQDIMSRYPGSFILTSKVQTDGLEARFGQYRQLCGANYHVAFQEILESEQKLMVSSLLHLYSKMNGTMPLKEIMSCPSSIENTIMGAGEFDNVSDCMAEVLSEKDSKILSYSDRCALVYVCGYTAKKALSNISCDACKYLLLLEKEMQIKV